MTESVKELFSMDTATMLYWCAAVGGSVVFLISLLLHSFEIGGVDSPDVAPDGTFDEAAHVDTGFMDFQLISIRSLMAFATMFGWSGVIWGRNGWSGFFLSFVIGFIAMYLTALLIHWMLKLQHSGNVTPRDIIGRTGTVYLGIPGSAGGTGKVTVVLSGSTVEIAARAEYEIPTGMPVRVKSQIEGSTYLVEKVEK